MEIPIGYRGIFEVGDVVWGLREAGFMKTTFSGK